MTGGSREPSVVRRKAEAVVDYWSDTPWVDYAPLVLVGVHVAVVLVWGRADVLGWLESGQRQVLYQAGAGVVALIGGLGAMALAVYQALDGIRATAVKKLYANELRRNWLAVITGTGLSALACLIAIALDRGIEDPLGARFLFEAALVLAVARFGRLLWLFNAMLRVEGAEANDQPPVEAPPVAPRYLRPTGTGT